MLLLLLAACALRWLVVQAELDVMIDDAECLDLNEEYFKSGSCIFEVNDDSEYGTSLSTNLEVIKKFPEGVILLCNVYGINMGEYTNDIGLHVEEDFCEVVLGSYGTIVPVLKAIGFTDKTCPPEPGVYGTENYVVDSNDGLPESFPVGHRVSILLPNKEKCNKREQICLLRT